MTLEFEASDVSRKCLMALLIIIRSLRDGP